MNTSYKILFAAMLAAGVVVAVRKNPNLRRKPKPRLSRR